MQISTLCKCVALIHSETNDKLPIVTLKTDKGNIIIELYPECAPLTVENFIKLVESGFYNGLLFHRYVKGFVIQGEILKVMGLVVLVGQYLANFRIRP